MCRRFPNRSTTTSTPPSAISARVSRTHSSHPPRALAAGAGGGGGLAVPPPAAPTPPWEQVRAALTGAALPEPVEASEFVYASPLVPAVEALRAYGAKSFTSGRPILAAARELTSRIKADFEYHPGATDISTPLGEGFAGKAGVCQDFAHVEIAALLAHGLAARYVSGYIRTVHSREEIALRGADASHAWVAVWCGEQAGWVQLDPTNDLVAKEDHVAVAWGRDFSDVSPLRGVILGGDSHSYGVAVWPGPSGSFLLPPPPPPPPSTKYTPPPPPDDPSPAA